MWASLGLGSSGRLQQGLRKYGRTGIVTYLGLSSCVTAGVWRCALVACVLVVQRQRERMQGAKQSTLAPHGAPACVEDSGGHGWALITWPQGVLKRGSLSAPSHAPAAVSSCMMHAAAPVLCPVALPCALA
jgi:hypothetical protein